MTKATALQVDVTPEAAYERLLVLAQHSNEATGLLAVIAREWNVLVNQNQEMEQRIAGLYEGLQILKNQRNDILQEMMDRLENAGDAAFHEMVVKIASEQGIPAIAAAWIINELMGGSRIGITIPAKNALERAMKEFRNAIEIAGIDADEFVDFEEMARVLHLSMSEVE